MAYFVHFLTIYMTCPHALPIYHQRSLNLLYFDILLRLLSPFFSTIQDLEWPFSEEEIAVAISSLKTNKSLGPDCFTAHFYKNLSDSLTPILLKTENAV